MDDKLDLPGGFRIFILVVATAQSAMPFLVARVVADTSNWCDNLMNALNHARANHGPDSHLKIHWLETTLKQLNEGQGLGFKVGRTVLDKKNLSNLAAQLYAVLSAVVTALLALDDHVLLAATGEECALSSTQADSIHAAATAIAAPWRNSSCVYNLTIAAVLDAL